VGGQRTRCLALGCDRNKGQAGQLGYGLLKIGDGKRKHGLTWNLAHESRNCSKGLIIFRISKSNKTQSNSNEFYSNLKLKHSINSK
jgi:hypothetical protein